MIIGFLDIFQLNSIHALFHFINFEYLSSFSRSQVFQLINYGDLYGFFFFFFCDYQYSVSVFYIV